MAVDHLTERLFLQVSACFSNAPHMELAAPDSQDELDENVLNNIIWLAASLPDGKGT